MPASRRRAGSRLNRAPASGDLAPSGNSQRQNRPSHRPVGTSTKWCCQVVSTDTPISAKSACSGQWSALGSARR